MLLNAGFIPLPILSQQSVYSTSLVYCPNGCTTLMQRYMTYLRNELYLSLFLGLLTGMQAHAVCARAERYCHFGITINIGATIHDTE